MKSSALYPQWPSQRHWELLSSPAEATSPAGWTEGMCSASFHQVYVPRSKQGKKNSIPGAVLSAFSFFPVPLGSRTTLVQNKWLIHLCVHTQPGDFLVFLKKIINWHQDPKRSMKFFLLTFKSIKLYAHRWALTAGRQSLWVTVLPSFFNQTASYWQWDVQLSNLFKIRLIQEIIQWQNFCNHVKRSSGHLLHHILPFTSQ